MNVIAEIHVSHDDLVLLPTIRSTDDATIRWEYETTLETDHGRERVLFVSVFGDTDRALEAALEADHTVADPTRIATFAERTIYRVRVSTDLELVPPSWTVEWSAFTFRIVASDRDWILRVHLPDRDALVAFNDYCRRNDISFRVAQLYESDSVDELATIGLSDQQRDILLTALYVGYYDIPRQGTQEDIADQLGISTSAVSQRLRRAVAQLIVTMLDLRQTDRSVRD
ncbi:helix-turn-helix domain-containing protein [Halobacteria archaeon AArc-m2/3/4]|uniref:Helix-turn-helix domain-containing protein n=1 Tax=Natronoglomus mannanivorans TaxID=2979990 RepID=A0AAP3E2J9_9EURY|nr:helix-turn-helix domain-containing protein [Halobacteria archaeon AArc-xg1-1]MCU4974155.1 helix-turn-helix domain-containing protein [Halobacteria archaeon AArc-m2/3/4]